MSLLGKAYYELGSTKAALRYLKKAYRKSPRKMKSGLVTLGMIYYEKKKSGTARKYFKRYLRYYPKGSKAAEARTMLGSL